jgi:adenylyl- and sulfurtransferase ThiI
MKEVLLLRHASEISLKSHFVRVFFQKTLSNNIKKALKNKKIVVEKIQKKHHCILVYSKNPKKLIPLMQKIFGLNSIALAYESTIKSK